MVVGAVHGRSVARNQKGAWWASCRAGVHDRPAACGSAGEGSLAMRPNPEAISSGCLGGWERAGAGVRPMSCGTQRNPRRGRGTSCTCAWPVQRQRLQQLQGRTKDSPALLPTGPNSEMQPQHLLPHAQALACPAAAPGPLTPLQQAQQPGSSWNSFQGQLHQAGNHQPDALPILGPHRCFAAPPRRQPRRCGRADMART